MIVLDATVVAFFGVSEIIVAIGGEFAMHCMDKPCPGSAAGAMGPLLTWLLLLSSMTWPRRAELVFY